MITLKEELPFVESYIYLLKTRFDQNLSVNLSITENSERKMIAPMVIQLLLENAIKHNVVSKSKPLTIKISEEDGFLEISNNLQLKSSREKSSNTGLNNIRKRYEYLSSKKIEITETDELFSVKIPLLDRNNQ